MIAARREPNWRERMLTRPTRGELIALFVLWLVLFLLFATAHGEIRWGWGPQDDSPRPAPAKIYVDDGTA